jgi:hypothetical protein
VCRGLIAHRFRSCGRIAAVVSAVSHLPAALVSAELCVPCLALNRVTDSQVDVLAAEASPTRSSSVGNPARDSFSAAVRLSRSGCPAPLLMMCCSRT